MDDGLKDVISAAAAASGSARPPDVPTPTGRVTPLRPVDAPAGAPRPPARPSIPDQGELGRGGLRLAFWLCGFHEALVERQRQGEQLTPREESLLALSRKDFASLRPSLIDMALSHLEGVVNDTGLLADARPLAGAEMFAFTTVRNLAAAGRQILQDAGAEAALSLFGGDGAVQEPLAVFQLVFSATLGLVEAFDRLVPGGSRTLGRLSAALDAEIGKI